MTEVHILIPKEVNGIDGCQIVFQATFETLDMYSIAISLQQSDEYFWLHFTDEQTGSESLKNLPLCLLH